MHFTHVNIQDMVHNLITEALIAWICAVWIIYRLLNLDTADSQKPNLHYIQLFST